MAWRGIDVSKFQGIIDWTKPAKQDPWPIQYAIVKASQGDFEDPRFTRNQNGAREWMKRTGYYHFLHWGGTVEQSKTMGRDQANLFTETVGGFLPGEFAALDVEARQDVTDPRQDVLHAAIVAFLERLGQNVPRLDVAIYCNRDWERRYKLGETFRDRALSWIAAWGLQRPPTTEGWPYWIWQFGKAKVAGIAEPCDVNAASRAFIEETTIRMPIWGTEG